MAPAKKHADHEYIANRQNKYIEAWSSGLTERVMEFMDKEEYGHSTFGLKENELGHDAAKELFAKTFDEFNDLKVHTRSLHGHKHFTAWEWTISYRHAKHADGKSIKKEDAPPKKLVGCTLMWWNDSDKITKSHEYMQVIDVNEDGD